MAQVLKTPGVYIEEKNAFPNSVVAVATAVPAFIGYTAIAIRGKKSLNMVPTRITSLAEYISFFGGASNNTYDLVGDPEAAAAAAGKDPEVVKAQTAVDTAKKAVEDEEVKVAAAAAKEADAKKASAAKPEDAALKKAAEDAAKATKAAQDKVTPLEAKVTEATKALATAFETAATTVKPTAEAFGFKPTSLFYMYNSLRLFFANGGGPCYIVSVGLFKDEEGKPSKIEKGKLIDGIAPLLKEQEPTMVLTPDAMRLEEAASYDVQTAVLRHCGFDMKSRVAIFDVYNGDQKRTMADDDVVTKFRTGIGTNFLGYSAAYYPWLNTTIVEGNELDYNNISNLDTLVELLNAEFAPVTGPTAIPEVEERKKLILKEIAKMNTAKDPSDILALTNTLKAVSSLFKEVISELANKMNVLPPAAAMAGIYTMVDNTKGVHKAPANVSLNSVIGPTVNLTAVDQEDLNLPLNGKAINAIRHFIGKGTLVWGARTLDGNSNDWRYINVRRTLNMIEESIRIAAGAYVFEPNDANTWTNMKGMLDSFLTNQWTSGALVGPSPADSFSVDVGLGVTMTPQDVLEGIMRISVKLAISRPAEFIVITFQQQMQKG